MFAMLFIKYYKSPEFCFWFQRQLKYSEAKMKALKARNEYLLCIEAANAAIHKYYVEDIPDLIDVRTLCIFNKEGILPMKTVLWNQRSMSTLGLAIGGL